MGELGRLIEAYRDRQKYPVSDARIAGALGVSRSTVGNWIRGTSVPSPENLRALAHHIETSYLRVFEAAMADAGYLPKESDGDGDAPPMKPLYVVGEPGQPAAGRRAAPPAHDDEDDISSQITLNPAASDAEEGEDPDDETRAQQEEP